MIILNNKLFFKGRSLTVTLLILLSSCSPDLSDDPIPYKAFPDIVITLSNYPTLIVGTHILINDGGVRGIILYRKNKNTYLAFERNCTFHPNDACATVDVHSSTLFMKDSCCNSTFDFDGKPTGGPAWRPLHKYQTLLSGSESILTITDALVD